MNDKLPDLAAALPDGLPQDVNRRIRLIMELRGMGIADTATLRAMETVPRHAFAPPHLTADVYGVQATVPIGEGQTLSAPVVVARMTEALGLSDEARVLEIGTGSGYQAAILSRIAKRVYTIERHERLSRSATNRLKRLGYLNISTAFGDGMRGWPQQGPFDGIIVTAGGQVPPELFAQLKDGGMLVAPVVTPGNASASAGEGVDGHAGEAAHPPRRVTPQMNLMRYRRAGARLQSQNLGPVHFVPLLPGAVPAG